MEMTMLITLRCLLNSWLQKVYSTGILLQASPHLSLHLFPTPFKGLLLAPFF